MIFGGLARKIVTSHISFWFLVLSFELHRIRRIPSHPIPSQSIAFIALHRISSLHRSIASIAGVAGFAGGWFFVARASRLRSELRPDKPACDDGVRTGERVLGRLYSSWVRRALDRHSGVPSWFTRAKFRTEPGARAIPAGFWLRSELRPGPDAPVALRWLGGAWNHS